MYGHPTLSIGASFNSLLQFGTAWRIFEFDPVTREFEGKMSRTQAKINYKVEARDHKNLKLTQVIR